MADTNVPVNNVPYIVAVLVMAGIGIAGAVITVALLPPVDIAPVIAAIFGFLTPTTLSLLAFLKTQETHVLVNSRMTEFMATLQESVQDKSAIAKAQGVAQGVAQGTADANKRTDDIAAQNNPKP